MEEKHGKTEGAAAVEIILKNTSRYFKGGTDVKVQTARGKIMSQRKDSNSKRSIRLGG